MGISSFLQKYVFPDAPIELIEYLMFPAYVSVALSFAIAMYIIMRRRIDFIEDDFALVCLIVGIAWPITLVPCIVAGVCWAIVSFFGKK